MTLPVVWISVFNIFAKVDLATACFLCQVCECLYFAPVHVLRLLFVKASCFKIALRLLALRFPALVFRFYKNLFIVSAFVSKITF